MTYGLEYGDELLKRLSSEIKVFEDDNKKLFRFSDARFVLYVKNYNDRKELILIINKISEIFNNPFRVKDGEQHLNGQIGIVEIDNKHDNFDKILKNTLISLDYIKNNDSVNYIFFNELMENKLQREDLIEKELRTALSEENTEKLYLQYHPLVDLKNNKIVAFEALARMKTENLGFVSPMEFIDVAERKQLIIPLGNFILKTACGFINNIINRGYSDVKVAVNISGIQLSSKDFTDTVASIIKETNIKESNLELEITESVLLNNYDSINEKLKNLRENKITISLDDFGTGYSSFSRLGELNIDTVKIDQYFISKISTKEYKELIAGDIISMSHKLGLNVVAEGVEIQEQKDFLIENQCDIMQGYLFSKPLSEEDAIKLLKRNN
jgi:EAL domain-containing protein (putative c-di-GMP-specific phosphodiesterase class I)